MTAIQRYALFAFAAAPFVAFMLAFAIASPDGTTAIPLGSFVAAIATAIAGWMAVESMPGKVTAAVAGVIYGFIGYWGILFAFALLSYFTL